MADLFKNALAVADNEDTYPVKVKKLRELFGNKFAGYQQFSIDELLDNVLFLKSSEYEEFEDFMCNKLNALDTICFEFFPPYGSLNKTGAREQIGSIAKKFNLICASPQVSGKTVDEIYRSGKRLLEKKDLIFSLESKNFSYWVSDECLGVRIHDYVIDSEEKVLTNSPDKPTEINQLDVAELVLNNFYENGLSKKMQNAYSKSMAYVLHGKPFRRKLRKSLLTDKNTSSL